MMMPWLVVLAHLALRGPLACAAADHLDAFPRPRLVVEHCDPSEGCSESWGWTRSLGERLCRGGG